MHCLKYPLTILINKSLETGKVPSSFKLAKVIPIYKSKEKDSMNTYRPISLLPCMSKIIFFRRLFIVDCIIFVKMQGLLFNKQFGFRPKCSTIDAVSNFVSNTLSDMETNNFTVSVLLDLCKAFDTIDHHILLNKLQHYGVRGVTLEWFSSYFSGRSHYVEYSDTISELKPITCGVPQGSVLGPLLFIIYTNDLPNSMKHSKCMYSKCILFADDTTVYHS